ncbi:MAG: SsrA-binding protein SmpB [Bacillota bacterium]
MARQRAEKTIASNRKARHDYEILETLEAGIVLQGTEVKSLRQGRANLRDSYAMMENGEIFLHKLHIAPYEQGNRFNHEPDRVRKLLLHRGQINRLGGKAREKGFALVPLRIYFDQHGRAKVELALARGKRLHDKRDVIAERDAKRKMERALKERAQI